MNVLKWSLRCGKVGVCLLWFGSWVGSVQAGEAVPAAPSLLGRGAPANSTFHTELAVPHPRHPLQWKTASETPEPVALGFNPNTPHNPFALPHEPRTVPLPIEPQAPVITPAPPAPAANAEGIQWKPLIAQSLTFLWIEHSFRFLTEPGTREELRGPFFKDWFTSVRRTRGWRDGDPFIVNYVGHPMQGSVTNYIFVHNDPKYVKEEIGFTKSYFKSRMRAMLFSTVYSTQFELGPLGEAALGNVGRIPSEKSRHPSAFVDLVVTPTLGTAWMMAEDFLDRFITKRMETHVENRVVRLLVRGFLSPSHSFANLLRGKYPWHRDGRRL